MLVCLCMSAIAIMTLPVPAQCETVKYDLKIHPATIDLGGTPVKALAINGRIPGPTLTFTEGDHAVIRIHNLLKEETSIHWHGILLPNEMDGVPYITTMPIQPATTHTFEFPVVQSGTYWYHSHTNLQEQSGVYGAIVIFPKEETINADHDVVLVLSDWTNETPYEVLRTLKRGSDWYSIRKGTTQSWDRVIENRAVKNRLMQSFMLMPPMDVSDVYYDHFLINSQREFAMPNTYPGQTIRLRVINAAASTYFHVQFAGGPMKLISADGLPVEPVEVDRVLIATAETYDFLIEIPGDGAYEFRATAQDRSGHASAYLGRGDIVSAPDVPKPNLFRMHGTMDMDAQGSSDTPMSGHEAAMAEHPPGHQGAATEMNNGSQATGEKSPRIFDYSMLRSKVPTALPAENPTRVIRLELTGDMDRFVWSFNGKTMTEADSILIRQGENVRFVLVNTTMMHHPMHLHGHFFRVLNGQGDYAPLKHTVDAAPLKTTEIEFLASEDKDWLFHCHLLYHMVSGMMRVVHYEGSLIDPVLLEARKDRGEMMDDDLFAWAEASAMTHMNEGSLVVSNTRNSVNAKWDASWEGEYEVDADYERHLTRLFGVFAGGSFSDTESLGIAGMRYLLPLYLQGEIRIDTDADVRIEVGSSISLMERLDFKWFANTKAGWRFTLEYVLSKQLSIVCNYDSDYHGGVGVAARF